MKAAFALAAAAILFVPALAAPAVPEPQSVQVCGFPTIPLFRAVSDSQSDRIFTTDANEVELALASGVYVRSAILGYIYSVEIGPEVPNAVPFYRVYSAAKTDHFVTTSYDEVQSAVANGGYVYQGVIGYVYPDAQAGCSSAVPFYRTFLSSDPDHYYTVSLKDKNTLVQSKGFTDEGIAAYIFPPQ